MNNSRKLQLIGATAAIAFGLGVAPASAFETGTWSWDASVTQTKSLDGKTTLDAFPSGQLTADGIQMMIGNSRANAILDAQVTPPSDPLNPTPGDALADLGAIEGSADAYGNLIAIDGAVPISARIGQYHVGGVDPTVTDPTVADPTATDPILDPTLSTDVNPQHVLLGEMRDQAEAGLLQPHHTVATAEGIGISDVMVDLDARAVSNSVGYELTVAQPIPLGTAPTVNADGSLSYPLATDAVMTADTTQFSYGDTEAVGRLAQTIDNFTGIGSVDRPLSSVTATAIGNLGTASVNFATQ